MLVCHCLRVYDREIRQCVRTGACTTDEVTRRCGAGGGCGGCREAIDAIVETESSPLVQLGRDGGRRDERDQLNNDGRVAP